MVGVEVLARVEVGGLVDVGTLVGAGVGASVGVDVLTGVGCGVLVRVDVAGSGVAVKTIARSVDVGAGVGVCVSAGMDVGVEGARAMGRLSVPLASEKPAPALIQPEPALPRLVSICHHCLALSRPTISADAPSGR